MKSDDFCSHDIESMLSNVPMNVEYELIPGCYIDYHVTLMAYLPQLLRPFCSVELARTVSAFEIVPC